MFRRAHFILAAALLLASCERAHRYPPAPTPPSRAAEVVAPPPKPAALPAIWTWLAPSEPVHDAPLEFVPASSPLWASLPEFWNADPLPAAGARTIFLGLPPLEAVAAYGLADQLQRYRIKVPRGLPDPNPFIPPGNPPSFAKWRLGRDLFFAPLLQSGSETYACASCHQPEHGFAESRQKAQRGQFNTPSLINAVFNRHQFWDGRAVELEEVVVRSLDDERPPTEDSQRPELTHRWGGLVKQLDANLAFRHAFQMAFGVEKPTQDTIARALATYVRTLLSGDSLYDRAEEQRQKAGAAVLNHEHFLAVLDPGAVAKFGDGKLDRVTLASRLARGQQLFNGKANCVVCHRGPLFTDHDFHNIGLEARHVRGVLEPPPTPLPDRFATVPIGLKEQRLIGALATRSLRALPRTGPYFHAGQSYTLRDAVLFYDRKIWPTFSLATPLRHGDREQNLGLTDDEIDNLVLFLESLDGQPLDAQIRSPHLEIRNKSETQNSKPKTIDAPPG